MRIVRLFVGRCKIKTSAKIESTKAAIQVDRRDTNVATVVQKHPILQFNHTDTPRFFNKVSTS